VSWKIEEDYLLLFVKPHNLRGHIRAVTIEKKHPILSLLYF
jgi:hypothetical protein